MAAADLNSIKASIETHIRAGFGANIEAQNQDLLVNQSGLAFVTESPYSAFTPVSFQNAFFEPPNMSTWLQCEVSFAASDYLTLGGSTEADNDLRGTVIINIFSPKGVGVESNYELADKAYNLFNRRKFDGIHFGSSNGPQVVTPNPEAYFQSRILTEFSFIEHL
tara:strand:+ start:175 stop:669 length:495 start_codon:yes stop_codon:yes gene_type:complete